MKRSLGLIAFGLGILLLVMAPAIRFWVAPKLVRAPVDTNVTLPQGGTGFQYLSAKEGSVTLPYVAVTRHIQGDVAASNGNVAVYEQALCLTRDDRHQQLGCLRNDDRVISNFYTRFAFDRTTGIAVNGDKCGPSGNQDCKTTEDGEPVTLRGLGSKWPFFTQKKDYLYWDNPSRQAFPMRFQGVENKEGLTVYRFQQVIKDAPAMTNGILPSLYSNVRTVWVEPKSGVLISGQEQIDQRLTGRASTDPGAPMRDPVLAGRTALKGTLAFTPQAGAIQAKLARDGIAKIDQIYVTLPLICLVLGAVLAVLGLFLMRRGRSRGEGEGLARRPHDTPAPAVEARDDADLEPATVRRRDLHARDIFDHE